MAASPNYMANGTILPSRLVKIDVTAGKRHMVIQCDATGIPVGVAQEGTRRAPGHEADDGNAAIAGESLQVFGDGEECLVVAGGTIVQGDILISDANGKVTAVNLAAATGVVHVAGRAMTAAATNEKFRMLVQCYSHRAT